MPGSRSRPPSFKLGTLISFYAARSIVSLKGKPQHSFMSGRTSTRKGLESLPSANRRRNAPGANGRRTPPSDDGSCSLSTRYLGLLHKAATFNTTFYVKSPCSRCMPLKPGNDLESVLVLFYCSSTTLRLTMQNQSWGFEPSMQHGS